MNTDERNRLATVWDLIEHSAFCPKNENNWLRCYSQQLSNLLQLEPTWIDAQLRGQFQINTLNIGCTYGIESSETYVVSLTRLGNGVMPFWSTHVDSSCVGKAELFAGAVDYPPDEINTHLRSDIEKVLEGMVFHPRSHAHLSEVGFQTSGDIDPSCGMLKAKEIRVTGSAQNGFVFLYHLAFQLCVVSKEAREREKARLVDLFETAIKGNQTPISAGNLFDFKN